jgi:hypothetical protein
MSDNVKKQEIEKLLTDFDDLVNSLNSDNDNNYENSIKTTLKNQLNNANIKIDEIKKTLTNAINNRSPNAIVGRDIYNNILDKITLIEQLFSDTSVCNNITILCTYFKSHPITKKIYDYLLLQTPHIFEKCPYYCSSLAGGSKRTYKKTEKTVKIGKLTRCVHLYGKTEYVKMNGDMKTVKSAQKTSKSKK